MAKKSNEIQEQKEPVVCEKTCSVFWGSFFGAMVGYITIVVLAMIAAYLLSRGG